MFCNRAYACVSVHEIPVCFVTEPMPVSVFMRFLEISELDFQVACGGGHVSVCRDSLMNELARIAHISPDLITDIHLDTGQKILGYIPFSLLIIN